MKTLLRAISKKKLEGVIQKTVLSNYLFNEDPL